jgi:peptidoglycan/xylan/chitin deacetylase (PgdA/CDA1 family)
MLLALVAPGVSSAEPWAVERGCPQGHVALTFDDGPSPTTGAILAVLSEHGRARATFFNIGAKEQRSPELVRAEQDAWQAVGDHTYSHPYLDQLPLEAAYDEILGTQQIHRQITGNSETLFRPPFGRTTPAIRAAAASLGLTEVLWTVDTRDYDSSTSTREVVHTALSARNGDIVLMHDDGYPRTVAALPAILDGLAARGLCPGRVAPSRRSVTAWPGTQFHAEAVRW